MPPDLDALARAVAEREMRIAVFDAGLRSRTGQWTLETPIPVSSAISHFEAHGAFTDDAGRLHLPLHEPERAALTDEYVLVDPTSTPATVVFYDPARSGPRELPIEDFSHTYPAWRVRFWTDDYPIEETPPFLETFPGDEPAIDTHSRVVAGGNETRVDDFFEAARSAVVARREALRADARSAFTSLSGTEYASERGGITDLRAGSRTVDDFGQQVITLTIPADHHLADADGETIVRETGLRAGDEVAIDAATVDELPVEAELFDVGAAGLEVGVYWDSARGANAEVAFDPETAASLTVGKLVDGGRFAAISSALDTVSRTDRAGGIYAGTGELSFAGDPPELGDDHDLDRYQASATLRAATAEDLLCIEAPPWTGSRRTIWQLIRLATAADRRVAVITPDRAALDTLLEGGDEPPEDGKSGFLARARRAGIDLRRVDAGGEPGGADVVATPLERAERLGDHEFDLAIVDQAGRLSVPAGAVPFAKAGRVVLVGDPMQSPRTRIDRQVDTDLASSIYAHLTAAYGSDSTERLRCQYRMNQAIALYPNQTYYDGGLIHGGRNRTWSIDAIPPLEAVHVAGREATTPTGSCYNEAEIQAIVEEVRALREHGVAPEQIGIITPYSAQLGKIRVALGEEAEELAERVVVGGLDRFRCRHRNAIIVSTVRTTDPADWDDGHELPFWTDRGLNVTLTRACKRISLVGDWRAIRDRAASDPYARLASFLASRGLLPAPIE